MINRLILNILLPVFSSFGIDTKIILENEGSITDEKLFYETIWFYLSILLFLSALFYLIYRMRIAKLIALEKSRFLLLRDLHDDMGSTLSTINILSTMALKSSQAKPENANPHLEKISIYCHQMMESMDDIIWSLNPDNDSMNKIIYRMREFASLILEPKNIAFRFNTGHIDDKLGLNTTVRRDFYLIFKEAVNNLAKLDGCNKIIVDLSTKEKYIILTITGNGKHFEKSDIETTNAFLSMKKKAALIKGNLDVVEITGEGTRIVLAINKNKI